MAGETHADNLRHTYLRAHFMNALLTDPRVMGLFDEWGQQSGLYAAADAVAQSSQQFAEAMGAPHWTALRKRSGETDGQPFAAAATCISTFVEANVSAPAMPSLQSFYDEAEKLCRVLEKDRLKEPSPAEFVRATLGLQWAWLAYELVDSFFSVRATPGIGGGPDACLHGRIQESLGASAYLDRELRDICR